MVIGRDASKGVLDSSRVDAFFTVAPGLIPGASTLSHRNIECFFLSKQPCAHMRS